MNHYLKIVALLGFQFFAMSAWPQPGYEVIEVPHWLNGKFVNAYTIDITGASPEDVVQAWSARLLKAGGQNLKPLDDGVYACENVVFPALSQQPFEVFFQTYDDGDAGAFLTTWLKQGDNFLSTKGDWTAFRPVSRLFIQFSFDFEDQLKAQIQQEEIQRAKALYPEEKN
ncbi:MAG: hypothetical protein KDD02_01850 [Phaeodactylibacter sp.]|nr:hypothetical protein [Phaeodactylibacter sp.]MCB9301728.1 hypothetical protein [Lewinellaceae bacterium]HQU59279.1 hypothetical protein [Saprospiraceae bacterium]